MSFESLSTDYLVIGAGAMGMALTDVLLTESQATVVLVDRHAKPGGHWNDAYPFVRLHQPSAFYGVNSRKLGNDCIDQSGWNKGLYELASHSEVCAYFDQVMREQFLASGRVRYFPNCDYFADGEFTSLITGQNTKAQATKIVDATYMNVAVPSVTKPNYQIAPEATCVPVNDLPKVASPIAQYVIVGAGKTGMDACLWLLASGVNPDSITWIVPRDSWVLDRANIQPQALAQSSQQSFVQQLTDIAASESLEDCFHRVNVSGQLLRISDEIWPTMYRCATVTQAELAQLKRIKQIVRKGRVQRIEKHQVVLDEGNVTTTAQAVYIDCSADGLKKRPVTPIFNDQQITLQSVRFCQQVFSAALIGHVEVAYQNESEKNKLCTVVPHPDSHYDFLRVTLANLLNSFTWSQYPELQAWLVAARLDGFSSTATAAAQQMTPKNQASALKAIAKLQRYLAQIASG